jgi:hypothetical protein
MFNPTTKRAVGRLTLFSLSAILLAACDRAPTSPESNLRRVPEVSRHDDILGDTLACHSGYNVIDGRYVCN